VAFRRKIYRELQADQDAWIVEYNEKPPIRPLVLWQDADAHLR
jgi:hypothetical protein